MVEYLLGAVTALWLGILTSLSPCPLATNIAAISFVGRRVESPKRVLATGFLYTLGRAFAYASLGALLVLSLLSAPYLSHVLQKYMSKILGPLLVLVGMFLLELIRLNVRSFTAGAALQNRAGASGVWGGALLGIVFALSFCPVSAALFFGSLIPLAVRHHSGVLFPSVYGIGTALPVVVFSILIATGARSLGSVFKRTAQVERWARLVTGVVFVAVGIYLSLTHIFGVGQ